MSSNTLALLELLLVFGVALGIGWWQLRQVNKRRQELRDRQENSDQGNQGLENSDTSEQ